MKAKLHGWSSAWFTFLLLCPAVARPEPAPEAPEVTAGAEAKPFWAVVHNPAESGATSVELADLTRDPKTKAVLISFFKSDCPPCLRELPLLQRLHEEFGPRGLRVVSVGFDEEGPAWAAVTGLIKQNKITYPVARDLNQLIALRYLGQKTLVPSLFIVGADRTVKLVKQGYTEDASKFLRAEVVKALRP